MWRMCGGTAASPLQAGTGGAEPWAGHAFWAGHSPWAGHSLLSVTSVVELAMPLWLVIMGLVCSLSVLMCDFDILPRSLHEAEGGLAQLNASLPQRITFTLLTHATALPCSCSRQELREFAEHQTNINF